MRPSAAWRLYQEATGITPASRSSVVVTPSKACMRSAGIDWPCACRSMKPGATAFIVALRLASVGASDSTIPITPAFEAA